MAKEERGQDALEKVDRDKGGGSLFAICYNSIIACSAKANSSLVG